MPWKRSFLLKSSLFLLGKFSAFQPRLFENLCKLSYALYSGVCDVCQCKSCCLYAQVTVGLFKEIFFLKRNVTSELALLQMLNDPFLTPSCFFFPEGSSHSVFPRPVLNHCCTVWWYTLSSKNFLLFTFSKPAWNEAEGKELERDGKK